MAVIGRLDHVLGQARFRDFWGADVVISAWFNNSGPLFAPFWSHQAHHTSPKRKRGLEFASLTLRASMARMISDFEPRRHFRRLGSLNCVRSAVH